VRVPILKSRRLSLSLSLSLAPAAVAVAVDCLFPAVRPLRLSCASRRASPFSRAVRAIGNSAVHIFDCSNSIADSLLFLLQYPINKPSPSALMCVQMVVFACAWLIAPFHFVLPAP
jgi:hypothetical protein